MRAMAVVDIPPLPLASSRKRACRWAMTGMFVVVPLVGRVYDVQFDGTIFGVRVVLRRC
jgi:hypothetical protein